MTSESISVSSDQTEQRQSRTAQLEKNQMAIQLLEQWLADESGYEEENWPQIEQAIEEASAKHWAK